MRLVATLITTLTIVMSATWRCDASAADDDHGTFAFVQKNCVGCHNASVSSGGVDFSSLQKPGTFVQNREIWEHALAKLKAGEMPPPGAEASPRGHQRNHPVS